MKPELQEQLFEKYPRLFRQKDLSMTQTLMCWGMDCGDGWYNIIDIMCWQIQHHLDWHNCEGKYESNKDFKKDGWEAIPQVEFVQVKEKFGTGRFYFNGGNDWVEGVVAMAEAMTSRTCEECGKPGVSSSEGWIRTLCGHCHEHWEDIQAARWAGADEIQAPSMAGGEVPDEGTD